MRLFTLILLYCLVQADPPVITEIQDPDKKELIASIMSAEDFTADDFSLRIHKKRNPYGSAGNDSGEITHSYFFVVSDNDDYPKESVFEIGEFYGPNIIAVREKDSLIEVDIEYFANLKKAVKTIFVRHHDVRFQ
ncbi:MAG: hypothetical protein ACJAVN_002252 [Roseivirga sp.]|jgi:hypothetical protein